MAPRNFTQAFKSKVVEDAIRVRNWCQVASQHGIHESTVRAWIKASGRQLFITISNNNAITIILNNEMKCKKKTKNIHKVLIITFF